jgi:hypothetical protein
MYGYPRTHDAFRPLRVNGNRRVVKEEVAMRGKLWFLGGLAAGFVLGARAGREKYEELVQTARKVKDHPTVQEARGVVQEQTNRLLTEGKDKLSHTKLGESKIGERLLSTTGAGTGAKSIERTDTLDDLAMTGSTTSIPTSGTTTTRSTGSTTTGAGSTGPNSSSTGTTGTTGTTGMGGGY